MEVWNRVEKKGITLQICKWVKRINNGIDRFRKSLMNELRNDPNNQ